MTACNTLCLGTIREALVLLFVHIDQTGDIKQGGESRAMLSVCVCLLTALGS